MLYDFLFVIIGILALEEYSFIDYEVKKSEIPMRCEERVCDIRVPWCWRGYLLE